MKNTNKESKLQEIFKDTNHKLSMILNATTAAIWVFITAMNLYSLNEYAHVNTISPYFTGAAKAKKLERSLEGDE